MLSSTETGAEESLAKVSLESVGVPVIGTVEGSVCCGAVTGVACMSYLL